MTSVPLGESEAARAPSLAIRRATAADAPAICTLIRDFAAFEKLPELATGSPERLADNLSGRAWPLVEGFLAQIDGAPAGYALFYGVYSTFWTRPMLWLEDLYVPESRRGSGVGKALFLAVARVAVERGCARMDWAVLEWNQPAIEFYERLGAARHGGWHAYRLEEDRLRVLVGAEVVPG